MPDDALIARIDALEIRVAYQDETIEDLNSALAAQYQELEKLRREMVLLQAELRESMEGVAAADGVAEPPPPHY